MIIKEYKGKKPVFNDCHLAENCTIIGDVVLEKNVSVWYGTVIRGDEDSITIEKGSNIQDNAVIHCDHGHPVRIGKNCTIGHGAIIHGCTLADSVLVGMGATLLNGCQIGENCIIGANALISENKVIPPNSLVVGIPGKVRRELTLQEKQSIQDNAKMYIELSEEL